MKMDDPDSQCTGPDWLSFQRDTPTEESQLFLFVIQIISMEKYLSSV